MLYSSGKTKLPLESSENVLENVEEFLHRSWDKMAGSFQQKTVIFQTIALLKLVIDDQSVLEKNKLSIA